jgi:hypothetical protein
MILNFKYGKYEQWISIQQDTRYDCSCMDFQCRKLPLIMQGQMVKCKHLDAIFKLIDPSILKEAGLISCVYKDEAEANEDTSEKQNG